jgi:serine/threonine protein kinase
MSDLVSKMAVRILNSLKTVHSAGRTYNDLKPDNIMVSGSELILIDFGLCDKFINSDGEHCGEEEETQEFKGNLIFASLRQLQFM